MEKVEDILLKKTSIDGEFLSGGGDSEFMIPSRRSSKRLSSALLDGVKIGTDSFRILKDNKFTDDYMIINCIGEGGYGKVYKVVHTSMGHTRAMKSTIFSPNLFHSRYFYT